MNYSEQILEIKKIIQNKEYAVAEEKLLSLISAATVKNVEDENNTYYSFNNYIETLLFWNIYRPKKKNTVPDVNYAQIYYYLGFINIEQKNYGKAIEYLEKGLQWNPINVLLNFEKAAVYRMSGEIERFKAEIEKTHSLIYSSSDLAKFYRELGWYYIEKRVFDLANALYTASIEFLDTELARNELMFIAKQENRDFRFSTKEEIKKLLADYNIWSGFNKNTVNLIYEEYQRLGAYKPQPSAFKFLSQMLYDITLDKKFMTYYPLSDVQLGVSIKIPDTWKYLEKTSYEKFNISPNTTFLLLTASNQNVSIVCDGKCTDEQLDEAYKINLENMKKQGTIIVGEYRIGGQKKIKQVFVDVNKNDKVARVFQNYLVVNGYLFNVSWQVPNNVKIDELYINVANSFAMGVVWSMNPININKDNSPSPTDIVKDVLEQLNGKKTDEDFTIKNINEEYEKNKISDRLIKMLHIFADSVIKDNNQDPFWTDTAKNVLEIIVLTNLITKNSCSKNELVIQVKDTNIIKTTIKDNLEKLSIPELNGIMSSKSIVDSDKPFESVMDIIRKALAPKKTKLENNTETVQKNNSNTDNLKEYSQEMEGYPTFKFYFPENLGEYFKVQNNIFELRKNNKQVIRVMVSKCSKEEKLDELASNWIEKTRATNKQEIKSFNRENIGNQKVLTYILGATNQQDKIYKIVYKSNCWITISGTLKDNKSEIINTAIEKIEMIENKKEEIQTSKPIIVDCPACNNSFELKWNVPATEKTFYCKCPNCGMELKRGNPNYKG